MHLLVLRNFMVYILVVMPMSDLRVFCMLTLSLFGFLVMSFHFFSLDHWD